MPVVARHQQRTAPDDLADFAALASSPRPHGDAHLDEWRAGADRVDCLREVALVEDGDESLGEPVQLVEARPGKRAGQFAP